MTRTTPLGALRWTLAQLRRSLGAPDALRADPLALGLPAGAAVDVLALASGDPDPGLVRGELLEGVDPGVGGGVRCVAAGGASAAGGGV